MTSFLLVFVMVLGFAPLGFAESLRIQLEQELNVDQIQCQNPDHVLVNRTNGNLACITAKTADRMSWEILKTDFTTASEKTTLSYADAFIKSDVEKADIPLGLYSKDMEGKLLREPPAFPLGYYRIIIDQTQQPTIADSVLGSMYGMEEERKNPQLYADKIAAQSQKYLKYFPDYVPDGMELKFIAAYDGGLDLVYAPIPVIVDPDEDTVFDVFDKGGIMIHLTHNTYRIDTEKSIASFYKYADSGKDIGVTRSVSVEGPYDALVLMQDNRYGGLVLLHGQIGLHTISASFPPSELYKMVQKAIGEDLP